MNEEEMMNLKAVVLFCFALLFVVVFVDVFFFVVVVKFLANSVHDEICANPKSVTVVFIQTDWP